MSPALEPGSTFAGYRIDGILGRGGMGVVYRAEDLHLGRTVALKVLAPERADDPSFRDRFLRESRLLASIDHRNIVDVFHADEADGLLFLAMRFIDGYDLGKLLDRQTQLEPAVVAHIIREAAEALDEAHSHGLVHRDVKPGNVLISPRGRPLEEARVYLSDFGLTKRAGAQSQLTTAGQFLGTPAYVAPEQIQGSQVDGRADLYALACVAYECLAGAPPYHEAGDAAVLMAHLVAPPPDLAVIRPELPPAVATVIATGMAKSRDQRPDRCVDFAVALERALAPAIAAPVKAPADEPAAAVPPPPPAATVAEDATTTAQAPPVDAAVDPEGTVVVAPAAVGTPPPAAVVTPPPAAVVSSAAAPPAAAVPSPPAPVPVADLRAKPRLAEAPPRAGRTRVDGAAGRRPSAVVAVGAAAVVLLAVAAIAFVAWPRGAVEPSLAPTAGVGAATPGTTPVPATEGPTADPGRTFPDAQEARLLLLIPELMHGACARAEIEPADLDRAIAVVDCRPTGFLAPSFVRYALYPTDAAADDAYAARLAEAQQETNGGLRDVVSLCTTQPHIGGHGEYTHGSTPGRVMCYRDPDGRAVFTWSVRILRVMSEAARDDGNAQQLYEWWSQPERSGPVG